MAVTTKKLEDLLEALIGEQTQDFEDDTYDIYANLDIDNSTGQQLLNIAQLVGQGTVTTNEDVLKGFIKGKIYQNASKGTYQDIYNVAKAVTFADNVEIDEKFPFGIIIRTDGTIPSGFEDYALEFIDKAAGAGVQVIAIKKLYKESGWFRLGTGGTSIYADSGFNKGKLGSKIAP